MNSTPKNRCILLYVSYTPTGDGYVYQIHSLLPLRPNARIRPLYRECTVSPPPAGRADVEAAVKGSEDCEDALNGRV